MMKEHDNLIWFRLGCALVAFALSSLWWYPLTLYVWDWWMQ